MWRRKKFILINGFAILYESRQYVRFKINLFSDSIVDSKFIWNHTKKIFCLLKHWSMFKCDQHLQDKWHFSLHLIRDLQTDILQTPERACLTSLRQCLGGQALHPAQCHALCWSTPSTPPSSDRALWSSPIIMQNVMIPIVSDSKRFIGLLLLYWATC